LVSCFLVLAKTNGLEAQNSKLRQTNKVLLNALEAITAEAEAQVGGTAGVDSCLFDWECQSLGLNTKLVCTDHKCQYGGARCEVIGLATWRTLGRTTECDWDGEDSEGRITLEGGGHSLEECTEKCRYVGKNCNFAALSPLGYCHLFRTCKKAGSNNWTVRQKCTSAKEGCFGDYQCLPDEKCDRGFMWSGCVKK